MIGLKIHTMCIDKNWSKQELANNTEIELSKISRIELGKSDASISTPPAIAKALKIKLADLFDF